jgi:hypothetical protein
MLSAGQGWRAAWKGALDMRFLSLKARSGLMEVSGLGFILAVLLVSIGLFARFRNFSHNIHGRDLFECKICGRIMCRTCRKGVHCQVCFKTVAGIHDSRVRAELVASLRNRAVNGLDRTGRVLDAVFPGSGRIFLGDPRGRFAWTLAVSLALGLLLGMRHPLMEYPAFNLGMLSWLSLSPIILVYGLHHIRFLRKARPYSALTLAAASREKEVAA